MREQIQKGKKVQGIFLVGKQKDMVWKTNQAYQMLKNIKLKAKKKEFSRSGYGEDDWWWDEDDTDWDNDFAHGSDGASLGDDKFGDDDNYFTNANGDIFYIDENGQVFEMIDTDGDGILDSPILNEEYAGGIGNTETDNTDNENWMDATRPGGIDFVEPDENDTDDGTAAGDDEPTGNSPDKENNNDKGNKGNPESLPKIKIPYNKANYPGFVAGSRNCMYVARSILQSILGVNANIGSPNKSMQLWGKTGLEGNIKSIFDTINSHLDNGRPILAGVDYKPGHPGNIDGITDHWIVIDGRGYDEERKQFYFTYIETGRSKDKANEAVSDNNRLYYDEEDSKFTGEK